MSSILPDKIEMSKVTLKVANLNKVKDFYLNAIGLKVLEEKENSVILGFGKNKIVELIQNSKLSFPNPRSAGLYHIAISFSSRSDLARTLDNIIENYSGYFHGSADHLVSEAFYVEDPEENGIELYFDKPKENWKWENGKVVMGSVYIDPSSYIKQYGIEKDPKLEIKVGHIHLKVGNLQTAKDFYVGKLGFEITEFMPSAFFVSKNKYHHHIGMNIWQSSGAGKMDNALGIESFEILIPQDISITRHLLLSSSIEFTELQDSLCLVDPWGINILIKTL